MAQNLFAKFHPESETDGGSNPFARFHEKSPPRSGLEAVNDTVIEFANAAAGGVSSAANFIKPGNAVSGWIDKNIVQAGEAKQTPVVQAQKQQLKTEIDQAGGVMDELGAVSGYIVRNPVLAAAQAAGSFVGPGAAVKGVGAIGRATGLGAKGVERAAQAGGVAAGAAMAGGDAAGTAYDLAKNAGATEDEAVSAGRGASVIPAIVGGASGAFGAERLLAGGKGFAGGTVARAAKTGASEAAQEAVEEGVTQYEGQRAAMPFDPTIDPSKGVAAAAGMGAALGGITGAGTSLLTGRHGGAVVNGAAEAGQAADAGPERPSAEPAGLPDVATYGTAIDQMVRPESQQQYRDALARAQDESLTPEDRKAAADSLHQAFNPDLFQQVGENQADGEVPSGLSTVRDEFVRQLAAQQEPVIDEARLREQGITPSPQLDTTRIDAAIGAQRPSEEMGLDPAAGSLSAAAALAVDSGAAAQTQQASAMAQAAEEAARAPAKKKATERQVTADPATGEIQGGAMATWTDEDLSNAFRSAQAKNVRLQLARELSRRRAERDQQTPATAPAASANPSTQQGSIDGTQADQTQPPRAESSPAAGAQGAPVAGPGPAQELTNGTTSSQHDGAQAGAAPGPQAQAPVQTAAQRIDAGRAAWASMPTAERKALAGKLEGLKPVIRKALPGATWERLNADLQRKIADAIAPQGETNDSTAPAVRMADERPAGPAAAAEAGGSQPAGRAADAQPAGPRGGSAGQPAAGVQPALPGRSGASEQTAAVAPAAAPAPTAGVQQAVAIAKEGNDARRALLLAASERWTSMPAAERQAVAKAAKGLNAPARAGAHTRAWADLAPKVREKLAAAMPDAAAAPAARAPALSVEGRDLGDGWAEFSRDSGSIGVPRAEMPQIRAEHRGAMVNFMNARGIAHQEESVQASRLKPTQAEFSRERVARARGFEGGNRSILVSRDGHVLDGHHQWLAAREAGEDVKVIRLDAPIRELLDAAREFPSSTTSEGAAQGAAPASAAAAKPKPRGVLAKKAAAEEAARADYFTPGNIVKGYGDSHVRVVSYTPANADGVWSVTVRQVEKQGSGWEDVPGVRERTHATPPSARELKAGPVERTEELPFRRAEAEGQGLTDDQMANLLRIMRPEPTAFSDAARAQAVGQVRETVDAIRKGWSNGPEVVVAFDMNDPAVPDAARRADLRQRSGGASGAPEGFYWRGKAYLLASKLNTPADAARVLHHEVLGHHGLRGMFGPELNKILNQVATMRHAEVAAKIKEYGLRGVTDLSRRHAAEEVLAEMAEKTPQLHFVQRAVAAIRNWLRANVPGFGRLKLSDADIIQAYILPARGFVERGQRAVADRIEPSFSRGAAEMSLVDKARVLQGEPVAVLRGDEAPQGYPLLRAWATKVFKDAGGQAVNPELGAVVLDERAVRDSMAHGMNPFKAAAFAAVPRILEQGVVVAEGRANDVQSYFVSAPVQIKGVDDIVTVLVRQDVNSRRMYLHSVITKENLLKARDSGAGAEAPEERSGKVTSGDVASVLRGLLQINTREAAGPDSGEDLMFSRSRLSEIKDSALDQLQKTMSHPGKVSVWDKTIGTMRHLAERAPAFKPVYETAQRNIDDVSMLANDAADRAPRLLPRVDTIGDLVGKNRKTPVSAADNKAVAKPLFEGTLLWGRDVDGKAVLVDELTKKYGNLPADDKAQLLLRAGRLDDRMLRAWRGLPLAQYEALVNSRFESKMLKAGAVWTDAELQTMFGATPNQIALYREARAAIDRSIDMTARADMMRALGDEYAGLRDMVLDAPKLADALELLTTTLQEDAKAKPDLAERLLQLNNMVVDRAATAKDLQDAGYAPLSRFGRYTLDVVDQEGNRQYFGMYETMKDANLAKIQMAQAFPGAVITQGTMSQQSFKLFAGITPETLEIFKDMVVGKEADAATRKVFDEYLKLTKNNHSALKRLIQRKGIEGYSQDVGRVVANFIYSNARQGAAGLNAGTMDRAINDIPKEQGELKDLAMGLRSYIRDPQEEGQAVRGMLFAQYLGGSLASAVVNMTQPFAVTLPWLSQFGGIRAASGQMARALKDMGTRGMKYEPDLAHALKSAEDDGVVSPQEVHQLMAQARGAGGLRSGDGTRTGDARAAAGNAWERAKVAWGQPFALAEQFNRRSTFIAAFRIAKAQGMDDPGAFARKAVLETQFVYSKANKPQWARGAVGGTLFTFKTYSVSYLELMQRMWKQGGPEGKRAVGWALAMLLLMGGAGGVPFMEDAEDLIDGVGQMMGYNLSSKQWRKEALAGIVGKELAEFLEQGVSGLPGAPIDVSGRLGMGNLLPGTGLLLTKQSRERDLLEVAGPAGDLVMRGFTAGRKVLTGDVAGAALEVSPTAVRNAVKGADMAASGMYKDTKGYKVIDTTLAEAVAKAIGFQPKSVAEVQEANSFMQRSKSFYSQTSSEIKAQWADALFRKDEGALARVRERLADWNKNNPEQPIVVKMPDIWRKVREMGKDRTDRIADNSPKALRQQMREMAAEAR
jgi:Large polyvalent protein-associated domain 3